MSLGDLQRDHGAERSFKGKRVLNPGEGFVSDFVNRYNATIFPFTIGLVAQRILPANPLRCYLLIQNKAAAGDIYINFGQNPTSYASIEIEPNGGYYEAIGGAYGGSFCPGGDVYILGSAAAIDGAVMEGLYTVEVE